MENTLNVGHMNPNGTRNPAGWVASSHGYDLDSQGRRESHCISTMEEQDIKTKSPHFKKQIRP